MSLKEDILKTLAESDGEFVSGEQFAKKYGKSRAALWKAINSLRDKGYDIEAVTNRGYRIGDNCDKLCKEFIKANVKSDLDVIYYDTIDSTNSEAKRLINGGERRRLLIVSDEQTGGRGRQGKTFFSPKGTGIYMTIVLHPEKSLTNVVAITTATGVAICRAVEKLTDKKPQIKWVNDVYIDDKKICGTLTEAVTDFESGTVTSIIIGIGMNINTVRFPSDLENPGNLGTNIKRCELIGAIADEVLGVFDGEYSDFIDYYRSHSMIIGREITFTVGEDEKTATAIGIDESGGLIIETQDGNKETLRSGNITIRPKK